MVAADTFLIPRSACSPAITARISAGIDSTAWSMAPSSRATLSAA